MKPPKHFIIIAQMLFTSWLPLQKWSLHTVCTSKYLLDQSFVLKAAKLRLLFSKGGLPCIPPMAGGICPVMCATHPTTIRKPCLVQSPISYILYPILFLRRKKEMYAKSTKFFYLVMRVPPINLHFLFLEPGQNNNNACSRVPECCS